MRNLINNLFQKVTGYKLIHKDLDIHLQLLFDEKYGHRKSRETRQSVDEQGNPIPWITYPAFEYLNQFDFSDKDIFEWGSGNSSLYFAERCKTITSVETNENWFEAMTTKAKSNMQIILKSTEHAAEGIMNQKLKYDLILIDSSSNRYECAKAAVTKLKEGGVIVLDNSARHLKASQFLKSQGYLQIDMHGVGPIVKFTTTTSLFMDRNFNWDVMGDRQPFYSKASLNDSAI